ncbi:MAG: hypothetical protein ABJQ71_22775 [Roseibium sp.]
MRSFLDSFEVFKEKFGVVRATILIIVTAVFAGFVTFGIPTIQDYRTIQSTKNIEQSSKNIEQSNKNIEKLLRENFQPQKKSFTPPKEDLESLQPEVVNRSKSQEIVEQNADNKNQRPIREASKPERVVETALPKASIELVPNRKPNPEDVPPFTQSNQKTNDPSERTFAAYSGIEFSLCGYDQFVVEGNGRRIVLRNLNRTVDFKNPDQFRAWDLAIDVAKVTEIFPGCRVSITPRAAQGTEFFIVSEEFRKKVQHNEIIQNPL